MKISINELRQMIREEVVASTDDPTVVMYKVEPGDTETLIINKFKMTEEDYRRLNPEEFKGEGSTVKVKKLVDPCDDFPEVTQDDLADAIEKRLDLSNLKQAMDYKSIAGKLSIKSFAHGKLPNKKPAEYGYNLALLDRSDLGDMLQARNKEQLKSLGKEIYVVEMSDLTGAESAKVFRKMPPVILAQDPTDDSVTLVKWDGKKFNKGTKKFVSTEAFTKAIVDLVDNMFERFGGLEMIAKCAK
jgi:hypothetical protein